MQQKHIKKWNFYIQFFIFLLLKFVIGIPNKFWFSENFSEYIILYEIKKVTNIYVFF